MKYFQRPEGESNFVSLRKQSYVLLDYSVYFSVNTEQNNNAFK